MQAVERLVDASGEVRRGRFEHAIDEVNFRDYILTDDLGRPPGFLRRRFGFHQFQFLGAASPELVFGCAVVDLGYLSAAFAYFYETSSGRLTEVSFKQPLGVCTSVDQRPEDGGASFRAGRNQVQMSYTGIMRSLHARFHRQDIRVDAHFDEGVIHPLRLCTPTGPSGWVFTRKTAGVEVTGTVRLPGGIYDLGEMQTFGNHDWTAGFMRRDTFWRWASLGGRLADGRVVGVNASCGVNETSFGENCFWIDGVRHDLGGVDFDFDRFDTERPWRIKDAEGRMDLRFRPLGAHTERTNAIILKSRFTQLFGQYSGHLTTAEGERVVIDGLWGCAEDHFARW